MDRFFSLFGKIILVLLVISGLVGGGYYLGQRYHVPFLQSVIPTSSVVPTLAVSPTESVEPISPTQAVVGRFFVGGGGASQTSFSNAVYILSAPNDWKLTKIVNPGVNKVILTKGDYEVSIYQAALGGGGCTFPGDAPQEMSISLTAPTADIPLIDGTILKRGQADSTNYPGKQIYDVCQKGNDGTFGNLTYFGVITYTVPVNPNKATLAEMDDIIGTLQKK